MEKECSLCNRKFTSKLKQHIQSVHEGKKPYKCSLCDYTSAQKGNLQRHIQSIHESKKLHTAKKENKSTLNT